MAGITRNSDMMLSTASRMLDAVKQNPGSTHIAIAKALRTDSRYVDGKLNRLAELGMLRKERDYRLVRYSLTDFGGEMLDAANHLSTLTREQGQHTIKLFTLSRVLDAVYRNYGIFKSHLVREVGTYASRHLQEHIAAMQSADLLVIDEVPKSNVGGRGRRAKSCYLTEKSNRLILNFYKSEKWRAIVEGVQ
ncbi:MAG: hypothetical protein KGH98_04695 [Candidatus Micrarchaeota archaeon]|nr:hypothetical protein [Candidatus Micrarchaeota archaeon]